MKYVLDTNIVSEPMRLAPNTEVEAWLTVNWDACGISVITLAELRYGIERMPEGKRRRSLRRELEFLLEDLEGRILPFDQAESNQWGGYAARLEQHFGTDALKQFDLRDTLIAATALEFNLIVATNNQKHFPLVETFNPFAGA